MPSSRCNHVPIVISVMRQLKPRSILDIGVGFGKWGHLFREYTDIIMSETQPERYYRENWRVVIDGIEGYAPYLTPMHEFLYNNIYLGDMREQIHKVGMYDVVFMGDVIEHVDKGDGNALLNACLKHANKAVIVTTPARDAPQEASCGNELEIHRSLWTEEDFESIGRCTTKIDENDTLIAVLLKEDVKPPKCEPQQRRKRPMKRTIWQRARRRLQPVGRLLSEDSCKPVRIEVDPVPST